MKQLGKMEHTPYFNQQRQTWCIALSLGKNEAGKRIRKIITGKTEEAVWQCYQEYIAQQSEVAPISVNSKCAVDGLAAQMNLRTYIPQQDILFYDHFKRFLENLEISISNKTYSGYVLCAQRIREYFENIRMYEVDQQVYINFFKTLTQTRYCRGNSEEPNTYYSQSYLDKFYNLLRRFSKSCSDPSSSLYLNMLDYMNNVPKPQSLAWNPEEAEAYTEQDIKNILKAVENDPIIYCWIRILSETGVRPSEALALQWDDINWQKSTISINKTLGEISTTDLDTGKRSKVTARIKDLKNDRNGSRKNHCRVLSISAGLLESLQKLMKYANNDKKMREGRIDHGTTDQVFTSPDGKMWVYKDYLQRYIRALKKANIYAPGMNPYRFRHTVCTYYVLNGYDPKTIQILMGDETIDVIYNIYTNLKKDEVYPKAAIAADRISKIYANDK